MRILKTALKTLLGTLLAATLLAGAAVAAVNWLLPSRTVKPIILDYAGRYLDRRITIGGVRVNVFTGISLRDVRIGGAEGRTTPFVTARGVSLGYRLLPLLRKRIEVTRVRLDGPSVSLARLADGTWNFESLLRMMPPDTAPPPPAGTAPGMPFMLDVSRLELTDAALFFDAGTHGHVRGINLRVDATLDTALVPRGTVRLSTSPDAAPHLLAVVPPAPGSPGGSFRSGLRLNLAGRMAGLEHVELAGRAVLESLRVNAPGMPGAPVSAGADLDLAADLGNGALNLRKLGLLLNGVRAVELSGNADGLFTAPAGSLRVTGGAVPLAGLNPYLPSLAPGLSLGGAVSLAGTRVSFSADSALAALSGRIDPVVNISGFRGRYRPVPLTADIARFRITGPGSGTFDSRNASGTASVRTAVSIEGITLGLPDMRPVRINTVRAELSAETGPDMRPRSVVAGITVRGPGTARFTTADTVRIRTLPLDIDVHGAWELTGLNLADVPVPLPVSGIISLSGAIAGSSYSRITLRTDMDARDIAVPYRDGELRFPPLRAYAGATIGFSDATFQYLTVDALDMDVDGMLSVTGTAAADSFGLAGVTAELGDCRLDLARLSAMLPAAIIRQVPVLEGMELSGILRAGISLRGRPGPVDVPAGYLEMADGTVTLDFDEAACVLPQAGAALGRLNGTVTVALDRTGATVTADAAMDGIRLNGVLPDTLGAVGVALEIRTDDLSHAAIERLDVTVPEYGLTAGVSGLLSGLMTSPAAVVDITAGMQTERPRSPLPGISYAGRAGIRLHAVASADREDTAYVDGSIEFDEFTVEPAPGISISGINGTLPFRQAFVFGTPRLIPSTRPVPVTEGLDYLDFAANRALYRATLPDLGYLDIAQVTYDQYRAGGISMDMRYRDNRLDVRRMEVNDLYHGNLAGALQVDLGDGRPERLLRTVSYGMVVQLAEVDADSLVLSVPGLRAVHARGLGRTTDEAKIGADITVTGTGLDLAAAPEINGAFNFSKIGSRVAVDLLYLLDPEGKDRSINQTRFLLKRGARPENMRFTVRQNFLYTSIYLDMPKYIRWNPLINIPQPIEYARTPIITTMKNLGVL